MEDTTELVNTLERLEIQFMRPMAEAKEHLKRLGSLADAVAQHEAMLEDLKKSTREMADAKAQATADLAHINTQIEERKAVLKALLDA